MLIFCLLFFNCIFYVQNKLRRVEKWFTYIPVLTKFNLVDTILICFDSQMNIKRSITVPSIWNLFRTRQIFEYIDLQYYCSLKQFLFQISLRSVLKFTKVDFANLLFGVDTLRTSRVYRIHCPIPLVCRFCSIWK